MKIVNIKPKSKNAYSGIKNSMNKRIYTAATSNDACSCTGNSNCF